METMYGWRRKESTPHPRHWSKATIFSERAAFMDKFYDRIGDGIDIWRAWDIFQNSINNDIAYIANTGNHTIGKLNVLS
ncbi:hypothetical protein, partial [Listeria monocytogenes]|uniref:hypothetical protein n=1 Tax=Listeria monocytogenes TaxID=1639 RepID=UPI002FDBF02C